MQVFRTYTGRNPFDVLRRWWLVLAIIAGVAGCGGGGTATTAGAAATTTGTTTNVATDVLLAGSVGDGPVTGATVSVYASDGSLLGAVVTDSSASFRSTVKARGRDYPLRLVVSGGIDLVTGLAPDFEMVSLLQHPSDKQANMQCAGHRAAAAGFWPGPGAGSGPVHDADR
jgi:hypothetical protein